MAQSCFEKEVPIQINKIIVSIPQATVVLGSKETIQATAQAYTRDNELISGIELTWSSSDEKIAVIDENGQITLLAGGSTMISATYQGVTGSVKLDIQLPLQFISLPVPVAVHNSLYRYEVLARSIVPDARIQYHVIKPSWMEFDSATRILSGVAGWENLGKTESIIIQATDGINIGEQHFSLTVNIGEIQCETPASVPAQSPYILPYEVGLSFKMIQGYCPPDPTWGHYNWFAYDFEMPIGTKVLATRAGEVLHIEERWVDGNRTMGQANYVYILHEDGSVAEYYHLTGNGVLVELGERVNKGQVIAISGDTGPSIGPHLHFVVYRSRWEFSKYQRQYTLPISFSNAAGPLTPIQFLIQNQNYTALPF